MKLAVQASRTVADLAALAAMPAATLTDQQSVFVIAERVPYTYYVGLRDGDVQPTDAASPYGWWLRDPSLVASFVRLVDDAHDFVAAGDVEIIDLDLLRRLFSRESALYSYSYTERVVSGNKVLQIIEYSDAAKTFKLSQTDYTYSGSKVVKAVRRVFDLDGNEVEKHVEEISYINGRVGSKTKRKGKDND